MYSVFERFIIVVGIVEGKKWKVDSSHGMAAQRGTQSLPSQQGDTPFTACHCLGDSGVLKVAIQHMCTTLRK